jgi:hypothetical protein
VINQLFFILTVAKNGYFDDKEEEKAKMKL